jgi:hypothetical protein
MYGSWATLRYYTNNSGTNERQENLHRGLSIRGPNFETDILKIRSSSSDNLTAM